MGNNVIYAQDKQNDHEPARLFNNGVFPDRSVSCSCVRSAKFQYNF